MWTAPNAVLEQADRVTGPWTPVSGPISPFPISTAIPARFFRLR
jgi:hypothetical protein